MQKQCLESSAPQAYLYIPGPAQADALAVYLTGCLKECFGALVRESRFARWLTRHLIG